VGLGPPSESLGDVVGPHFMWTIPVAGMHAFVSWRSGCAEMTRLRSSNYAVVVWLRQTKNRTWRPGEIRENNCGRGKPELPATLMCTSGAASASLACGEGRRNGRTLQTLPCRAL